MYPLKNIQSIPTTGPGSFGAIRKHDIHTGIDFYCNENDPVFAIEDGKVVSIQQFTGENVGCGWWNDTYCVIIRGNDGKYILYGEIKNTVLVGDVIKKGMVIGHIMTVLKKDKGLPMNMLHLEYYDDVWNLEPVVWELDQLKPLSLLNPELIWKK